MKVPKPWGWEEILSRGPRLVTKKLFVEAGKRLSLQYHKLKEESMVVLAGTGVLTLDDMTTAIKFGDICHPTPGKVHRIEAIKNLIIFEVSTPELDDVIRLQDDYGRNK